MTWQDYLTRAQDPFETLTWTHYDHYRNELFEIWNLERLFRT